MENIEDYIVEHISEEPELLQRVCRDTYLHRLYPRMCSGHLQGRLLVMLTQMIRPMRILELGTFTGYSTICFAEGMPEGAEIHTVEIDDEHTDELLEAFAETGRGDDIHLHVGDALDLIPTLGSDWDLVFIDANKRDYSRYYEAVLPRVRKGGWIFADNTLWSDKVVANDAKPDAQTAGILAFNDLVAADDRVEKAIMPIRDGMTIIRKK